MEAKLCLSSSNLGQVEKLFQNLKENVPRLIRKTCSGWVDLHPFTLLQEQYISYVNQVTPYKVLHGHLVTQLERWSSRNSKWPVCGHTVLIHSALVSGEPTQQLGVGGCRLSTRLSQWRSMSISEETYFFNFIVSILLFQRENSEDFLCREWDYMWLH